MAGPVYPTDIAPTGVDLGVQYINNVANHREVKKQVAPCTQTASSDLIATTKAHGLINGDAVVFQYTTGGITGLELVTGSIGPTVYYVNYVSTTTFKVALVKSDAIAGTSLLDITTDYADQGYYTPDGQIKGSELTNYSDTINDFIDTVNDTAPPSSVPVTTGAYSGTGPDYTIQKMTFEGDSIMAQLGQEITLLYDAFSTNNAVPCTAISGNTWISATTVPENEWNTVSGYANGSIIRFTNTLGNLPAGQDYIANSIAASGFKISNATTGTSLTPNTTITAGQEAYYEVSKLRQTLNLCTTVSGTSTVYTPVPHGFTAGNQIDFAANNGDLNVATNSGYYVSLLAPLSVSGFAVSIAKGGTPLNFTQSSSNISYYIAPLNSTELRLLANLNSRKFNDLTQLAKTLAFEIRRFKENINQINKVGPLPASRYPSGDITGQI